MTTAEYWIEKLEMQKHPEGGYYKEIYRSSELINSDCLPNRYNGNRNYSTSIYFLIPSHEFSSFRRLQTDEIWHFYEGCTLILHFINSEGDYSQIKLGKNIDNQEHFQVIVKAGVWCASSLTNQESYALIGATVAPGFDYQDFELGKREELSRLYPQHNSVIKNLTRE